ncbi:MAG TPA: CYTH domain-containing protein [Bacteroidales bacterium]|nr:CYTH domain-containing protein [Bacteroidales bacterium]
MNIETEHKYLVRKDLWYAIRKPAGVPILQGYILADPAKTVRVRIYGDLAFLTIKGPSVEASREEYEYPIPMEDARSLLKKFSEDLIDKVRYRFEFQGRTWEVDEFFGENEGLIIAEIELQSREEEYGKPAWLGEEVTGDPRYYNSYLASNPFSKWAI